MSAFKYILIIIVCGACNSSPNIKRLNPTEVNKNVLVSDNWNMQEYDDDFYLNDYTNNHILILNSSLILKNKFGKEGNGPGEFSGVGSFVVYEDSIYVYDAGGMRINVFTKVGEFERTILLPPTNLDWSRFAILNQKMFLTAAVRSGTDYLIMDLSGKILKKVKSTNEPFSLNQKNILSFNKYIVVLNKIAPYLEIFTQSGELLNVFDFREIEGLSELWKHYQNNLNQQQEGKNTTVIFNDAYIEGSFIYVLCAGWPGRDNYAYIVKLLLKNGKIGFDDLIKIQGSERSMSLFQSFVVKNNNLYAVESLTGYISKYDLSDN